MADIAKLSVGREEYYTRELATDHERTCLATARVQVPDVTVVLPCNNERDHVELEVKLRRRVRRRGWPPRRPPPPLNGVKGRRPPVDNRSSATTPSHYRDEEGMVRQ